MNRAGHRRCPAFVLELLEATCTMVSRFAGEQTCKRGERFQKYFFASLDMSGTACYNEYNKIFKLVRSCRQDWHKGWSTKRAVFVARNLSDGQVFLASEQREVAFMLTVLKDAAVYENGVMKKKDLLFSIPDIIFLPQGPNPMEKK